MMTLFMMIFIFALVNCSGITVNDTITITDTSLDTTFIITTYTTEINTEKPTDTQIDPIIFDYLYNVLPTNTVSRFSMSRANVSWFWNGPPVFSPDGKQVYWSKIYSSWEESEIWYKTKTDASWSTEKKLIIDGLSGYLSCPVFADNSDELYFKHLSLEMEVSIMKVTRIENEWSNPQALDIQIPNEYTIDGRFSIANNNIYFTLLAKSGMEHMKIFYSEYNNGRYEIPQAIDILNGANFGSGSPYIADDESFILFDSGPTSSYGVQDIYVSFRNELGNFTAPINLGMQVNSIDEENSVIISEDGQYLFFCSKRENDIFYTPYWIKIDEIEVFKTK